MWQDRTPEVHFTLHEELESDAALPLHLLLAVFKFDHMEWAIEKATELGIARITPILARRTEKHLAQSAAKTSRDAGIASPSKPSKQSRRFPTIPEIADPAPSSKPSRARAKPHPHRPKRNRTSHHPHRRTAQCQVLQSRNRHGSSHRPRRRMDPPKRWPSSPRHQWQPVTLGPRILPRRNRSHSRHSHSLRPSPGHLNSLVQRSQPLALIWAHIAITDLRRRRFDRPLGRRFSRFSGLGFIRLTPSSAASP